MATISKNAMEECQQYAKFVLQTVTNTITSGSTTDIDPAWVPSGTSTTTTYPSLTPALLCRFSVEQLTSLRISLNQAQMTIEDLTRLIDKVNEEKT